MENALNPGQPQNGSFDSIVNNPMQAVQAPLPQNPQEAQARKGQWAQQLEDPNFKSALFRMGLQMMRGTRPEENALGATARAGMDAMDFYASRNEIDRKKDVEAKKIALETSTAESQNKLRDAQTLGAGITNETNSVELAEWKTQGDFRKRKAEQEVANLELTGQYDKARLKKANFEIDEAQIKADFMTKNPGLVDAMRKAELLKPSLENQQTQAQTGNAAASSRRTNALTGLDASEEKRKVAEEDRKTEVWNSLTPEEKKSSGRSGGAGVGSDAATITANAYTAQAQSIIQEYARADKKQFPTIDNFMYDGQGSKSSKNTGMILSEIKRLQASGFAPTIRVTKDPKTGKPILVP